MSNAFANGNTYPSSYQFWQKRVLSDRNNGFVQKRYIGNAFTRMMGADYQYPSTGSSFKPSGGNSGKPAIGQAWRPM